MPLIIVTGHPSSGKTTTSLKISEFLRTKLETHGDTRQVRIVTDSDNLDWDGRDTIFNSISKEKELRGWLRSESQRYINLNEIVILDAAAYIKGFRYELYCMSKEAKTQYCIVEKLIDPQVCWAWNEERLSNSDCSSDPDAPKPGYGRSTFDALLLRYEKCDEENRWDSPLLRVIDVEQALDLERIYNIVTNEIPLIPNKCTITSTTTSTIYKPPK